METHLYFTFWGLNILKKGAMEQAGLPTIYKQYEWMLKTKLKDWFLKLKKFAYWLEPFLPETSQKLEKALLFHIKEPLFPRAN